VNLYVVAELGQKLVPVCLLRPRLFARPLKFNEQWPTTWNEKKTIRDACLTQDRQFPTQHPQLEGFSADLALNI